MAIVDIYGNPLQRDALKAPQTVKIAQMQRIYPDHLSRGLNIRKLPRILQAAEQGDLSAQASLFGDMLERDGHVFAEMGKRKNVLLTLDWSIEPPKRATAAEQAMTAQVQEWFDAMPDIEDIILNGMEAVGHGFSCQEIEWERVEKIWLPRALHLRPHYWFRTLPEQRDEIRLRDNNGLYGSPLWPFGWLVHRHNARSGFIATSGIYRVLVWPYLFKNFSLRDLAEFLEIYGLPARIATYAAGTSDADRDRLLDSLIQLGHEAVAAIPAGSEIKFESAASGGSDPFLAMINWAERTQSKIILGGTLTTQADGKSSTNALGVVHNEVRHDLMTADARQLEGMFKNLIQMVLALNGQTGINPHRLPRFVFDTRESVDLSPFATAVSTLVNQAGVTTIPVSWVHKKAAIPMPQDNEPTLAPRINNVLPTPLSHGLSRYGLGVLSQTLESDETDPAQIALDNAPPLSDPISAAMSQLLAPIVSALQSGQSVDDAMNRVATSYPDLDDSTLQQLLAQAIFVADIWGRLHADA
jgi:phage gp29-like protein